MKSAINADSVQNTFHFVTPSATAPYMDTIAAQLDAAYGWIDTSLSNRVDTANARLTMYDISIEAGGGQPPKPNPPVYDDPMTLSVAQAASSQPPELAICLSFQAASAAGRSQKRRRGRVYLGPWSQQGVVAGGDVVTAGVETAVFNMGKALLDGFNVSGDVKWVVYSPTNAGTGAPQQATVNVDNIWVDNAWDIQRRRGIKPTTRLIYPTEPTRRARGTAATEPEAGSSAPSP